MNWDRRSLLLSSLALSPALATSVNAAAENLTGCLSTGHFGIRAGSLEDQTVSFQRAILQSSASRMPLFVLPGEYRVRTLRLHPGARLVGVRGATRLTQAGNGPLITGERADHVGIEGLVLNGLDLPLTGAPGLVTLKSSREISIEKCEIMNANGSALHLDGVGGSVRECTVNGASQTGIFSRNAIGLRIVENAVLNCGNNGIQVWRSEVGTDATVVLGNRITNVAARDGGSGQNGNGINVFRANNVIVANNNIQGCAYSAIRANSASAVQILGNNCRQLGEVALYVEFGSEGALVANNIVDGASIGISITNFNEGGRLAIVQGNLLRNLMLPPTPGNDPDGGWGIGIHAEADATVSANVIENAARIGLSLGWAQYLRDVVATGNVIRNTPLGISISVTAGAGAALVKDNLIAGATLGAVRGFDRKRPVTGDLTRDPTVQFAQITVSGNLVR